MSAGHQTRFRLTSFFFNTLRLGLLGLYLCPRVLVFYSDGFNINLSGAEFGTNGFISVRATLTGVSDCLLYQLYRFSMSQND